MGGMLDRKIIIVYICCMNTSTAASILARSKKKKISHDQILDAAFILGRSGGVIGGPARAKVLSKAERKEIASHAANARWGRSCGCSFCR